MVSCKQVSWNEISILQEFCTQSFKLAILVKVSEFTYVIKGQIREWKIYTITDKKRYIIDQEVLDVIDMLKRNRNKY